MILLFICSALNVIVRVIVIVSVSLLNAMKLIVAALKSASEEDHSDWQKVHFFIRKKIF